jgi:hypothetical protein
MAIITGAVNLVDAGDIVQNCSHRDDEVVGILFGGRDLFSRVNDPLNMVPAMARMEAAHPLFREGYGYVNDVLFLFIHRFDSYFMNNIRLIRRSRCLACDDI